MQINDKIELELLNNLYSLKNISFNIKVRNKLPKIAESYNFDFVNIENARSMENYPLISIDDYIIWKREDVWILHKV